MNTFKESLKIIHDCTTNVQSSKLDWNSLHMHTTIGYLKNSSVEFHDTRCRLNIIVNHLIICIICHPSSFRCRFLIEFLVVECYPLSRKHILLAVEFHSVNVKAFLLSLELADNLDMILC
jgi:hypothetical protein